jgi:hypothetical protein
MSLSGSQQCVADDAPGRSALLAAVTPPPPPLSQAAAAAESEDRAGLDPDFLLQQRALVDMLREAHDQILRDARRCGGRAGGGGGVSKGGI